MDAHIYSVKVNSHGGNICVYVMTTKKAKAARYSARDLKNLLILLENLAGGPWDQERVLFGLHIYL